MYFKRYMRFDVYICLLLAFLVSIGVESLAKSYAETTYDAYKEKNTAEAGEVGSAAPEELLRVQKVEDLLSHDTFTVVSPGIEYRNKGGGYYQGKYLVSLTLPSKERVAAWINHDTIQTIGDDSILPIGKLIYENLSEDEGFIKQIETMSKEPLTRTDFYIDMTGNATAQRKTTYVDDFAMIPKFLSIFISFPIIHFIFYKLKIFPALIIRKKKQYAGFNDLEEDIE